MISGECRRVRERLILLINDNFPILHVYLHLENTEYWKELNNFHPDTVPEHNAHPAVKESEICVRTVIEFISDQWLFESIEDYFQDFFSVFVTMLINSLDL